MPRMVSPGLHTVMYTVVLAWAPECGWTLACSERRSSPGSFGADARIGARDGADPVVVGGGRPAPGRRAAAREPGAAADVAGRGRDGAARPQHPPLRRAEGLGRAEPRHPVLR